MQKILALLLVAALYLFFPLPANAHAGRTDSNGGHYDSATGEYHYHHGYPAHSHYDMDGDGDIDCPYDFDDQTSHNSSTSEGSISIRSQGLTFNDGYEAGYDKGYSDGYMEGKMYVKEEKEASYDIGYKDGQSQTTGDSSVWFASIGALLLVGVPTVSALTRRSTEKEYTLQKKEMEQRHKDELGNLAESLSAMRTAVSNAENRYELLRAGFDPAKSASIPEGVKVVSLVLPVKGRATKDRPYGDYTVYTSPQGTRYHCRYGCGNATRPNHFFTRPASLSPCRNCVPRDMYPQPLPDWYLTLTSQAPEPVPKPSIPESLEIIQKQDVKVSSNPNNKVFVYEPVVEPPKPPKFGPADEEFVYVTRSSLIAAVCYKNGNLYIKTTHGDYFMYYNVPEPVYRGFIIAPSMGKFFNQGIANSYPFSRL